MWNAFLSVAVRAMPKRIRKISFLLSKDELRLLREACLYGASAEGRLKNAVEEQGKVRLEFPYEELDDLAGHVASGANHETSSRKQARWDALSEKLESLLRLADTMLHLTDVLEHLHEPVPALAEIARVLKPGGVLIGATPDPLYFAGEETTHFSEHPP